MKNLQAITDRFAIGLSLLCAIHCLALPVLLVLLPSMAALQLDNEAFHTWMVAAVLPTSVIALTLGCKKHQHFKVVAFGVTGLIFLIAAVVLGEALLGETGEKSLTLIGATLIAWGHFNNFKLCQLHEKGECPEH